MSYDGAPFCGWQVQPGCPSVQGALQDALGTLLRCPVGVVGAGRTDTGVHALRYVAHFDFDGQAPAPVAGNPLDCKQLTYKLNAILPKGVCIRQITPADGDFHARFGAVQRSYSYFLHRCKDPFMEGRSYLYAYPDVDFDAMNRAARALAGTHDFSCFEKSGGDNKTSICTVLSAGWTPYSPYREQMQGDGPLYWRFDISADRFLRNMVRAIVGTLLEVGRGKRTVEGFSALVLPAGSVPEERRKVSLRSEGGESVPGHALYLTDVLYGHSPLREE